MIHTIIEREEVVAECERGIGKGGLQEEQQHYSFVFFDGDSDTDDTSNHSRSTCSTNSSRISSKFQYTPFLSSLLLIILLTWSIPSTSAIRLENEAKRNDYDDDLPYTTVKQRRLIQKLLNNKSPVVQADGDVVNEQQRHRKTQQQQNQQDETAEIKLSCSAAWMKCANSTACYNCYKSMIDYFVFNVATAVPCSVILDTLHSRKYCMDIGITGTTTTNPDTDAFCTTFDSCKHQTTSTTSNTNVNSNTSEAETTETKKNIDWETFCPTLTSCNFPGINPKYIGDGICHDRTNGWDGCYNTPICNYDGGDCCYESCHSTIVTKNSTSTSTNSNNNNNNNNNNNEPIPANDGTTNNNVTTTVTKDIVYFSCETNFGTEFRCRDPKYKYKFPNNESSPSSGSSSSMNNDIYGDESGQGGTVNRWPMDCPMGQTLYRINMYDSFGDGWDDTYLSIYNYSDPSQILYKDQLEYGAYGTSYVCLSTIVPTCYNVSINGGMWGREITWEVRGSYVGSPAIAYGTSPMNCQFGVAGISNSICPTTCTGGGSGASSSSSSGSGGNNDQYKTLKEMTDCINNRCFIQVAACQYDPICKNCYQETVPDSCYSSDSFNSLTDCTVCECFSSSTDNTNDNNNNNNNSNNKTEFCSKKASTSSTSTTMNNNNNDAAKCSSTELTTGGLAIGEYVYCGEFEFDIFAKDLVYDNEQFGLLDQFEACATTYANNTDSSNSGRTALGCMQLLVNAMVVDVQPTTSTDHYYPQLISEIASNLYHNSERFCDCSIDSYNNTPTCTAFVNMKTLLYEIVDTCKALDTIDCMAWMEYSQPCRSNLLTNFNGQIDFQNNPKQCDYIQQQSCGGAGPFPALRHLDCGSEIDSKSWSLYLEYAQYCNIGSYQQLQQAPQQAQPIPPVPPTPANPTTTSSTDNPTNTQGQRQVPTPTYELPPIPNKVPYLPPEERKNGNKKDSSYVPKKKSTHRVRNFIIVGILGCFAYYLYKKRQERELIYYQSLQQQQYPNPVGSMYGYNGGGGGVIGILGSTVNGIMNTVSSLFGSNSGRGGVSNYHFYHHNASSRMGTVPGGDDDIYQGLSMESSTAFMMNSSTASISSTGSHQQPYFESATLPPGGGGYLTNSSMVSSMVTNNNNNMIMQQQQQQQLPVPQHPSSTSNTSGNYAI